MAEIITGDYERPKKGGPAFKYPWDEWFDGQRRRLRRGEDFDGNLSTMDKLIRNTASKRTDVAKVEVIKEDEDTIVLTATLNNFDGTPILTVPKRRRKPTPNPRRKPIPKR